MPEIKDSLERFRNSAQAEADTQNWKDKIPFIEFPKGWQVQVIPPFAGAVIRFRVKNTSRAQVSVYLDCYETLGYFGGPHWEIYPNASGDNERFAIDDVKSMLKAIGEVKK